MERCTPGLPNPAIPGSIAPLDVPADTVGPFHSALKRMYEILYEPALRLTFKLQAGEGLLFNNRRVLHGRNAFEVEDPLRSVLTGSVDLEEFYSNLRLLRAELMTRAPPISTSRT